MTKAPICVYRWPPSHIFLSSFLHERTPSCVSHLIFAHHTKSTDHIQIKVRHKNSAGRVFVHVDGSNPMKGSRVSPDPKVGIDFRSCGCSEPRNTFVRTLCGAFVRDPPNLLSRHNHWHPLRSTVFLQSRCYAPMSISVH